MGSGARVINAWFLKCYAILTYYMYYDDYYNIIIIMIIQIISDLFKLRWYGHVMRREDENCMKGILTAEVRGRGSLGRQKKRWGDTIQQG